MGSGSALDIGKPKEEHLRRSLSILIPACVFVESATNPQTPPCIQPLPHDHRFDDERWRSWPFNLMHQSFLCRPARG
jgi:hypothetical protein